MPRRSILSPIKQGSRTPEEIREAVRKVMAERDEATWTKVKWSSEPDPTPARDDDDSGD